MKIPIRIVNIVSADNPRGFNTYYILVIYQIIQAPPRMISNGYLGFALAPGHQQLQCRVRTYALPDVYGLVNHQNTQDVKRRNTIGCLDRYRCRRLRLLTLGGQG